MTMFRKVILTALILAAFTLLIVAKSNAAPFLVCDPQSGVVGYEITGLGEPVSFVAQPDGSLKYDLASLPNGSYSGSVAACNMWGCGPATAIAPFVKAVPLAPAGVRLVEK
jgi:hypothetical protein